MYSSEVVFIILSSNGDYNANLGVWVQVWLHFDVFFFSFFKCWSGYLVTKFSPDTHFPFPSCPKHFFPISLICASSHLLHVHIAGVVITELQLFCWITNICCKHVSQSCNESRTPTIHWHVVKGILSNKFVLAISLLPLSGCRMISCYFANMSLLVSFSQSSLFFNDWLSLFICYNLNFNFIILHSSKTMDFLHILV